MKVDIAYLTKVGVSSDLIVMAVTLQGEEEAAKNRARVAKCRNKKRNANVCNITDITPPHIDIYYNTNSESDKENKIPYVGENTINGEKHKPTVVKDAYDNWNRAADQVHLSKAEKLTDDRRKRLGKILHDYGGLEGWNSALQNIADMPFCLGENPHGWRVNLDWLLRPANFVKIVERTYARS